VANAEEKRPSEVLKRGYSDHEIAHIYELGRLFLENGDLRKAESVLHGITEIAPEFAPGWLGMAYVHIQSKSNDEAVYAARQALRIEPDFTEATGTRNIETTGSARLSKDVRTSSRVIDVLEKSFPRVPVKLDQSSRSL